MSIILTTDPRDFQGTAVTVDVVRQLDIPRITLVVNQISQNLQAAQVREQVAQTYNCEVIGVLPHSPELAALAGRGIFARRYPDHPLTLALTQIAVRLAA